MATFQDITNVNWQLSASAYGEVVQGLNDLRQCLETILLTQKGTAVLRPDFGIDLLSYMDKPITAAIPALKREILEQVARYEPRVTIESITHTIADAAATIAVVWSAADGVVQQSEVQYILSSN